MRLRHILVQHEYEARDLERKLDAGEDFSAVARKFSVCSSRTAGGDLGDLTGQLHRLDETFREAAEALKPGMRSGPVRTKFGYHLILREI
jgi:parvulin-like peptidyl-prolyl isomerase